MYFIRLNINEYVQKTISDDEENFDFSELLCLLVNKVSNKNFFALPKDKNEPISIGT